MSVSSIPNKLNSEISKDIRVQKRASFWDGVLQDNRNDVNNYNFWRGALAEFLGTLLLAFFTIGFGLHPESSDPPSLFAIAVSVGFFLAIIISALTTVSGGHVNPAISLGFLVANQITISRFVIYTVCQTTGAIAGAAMLKAVVPSSYVGSLGLITPAESVSHGQALAMEVIISFNLVFVTLALVDGGRVDVQGSIPFMVGLTVVVNICVSGNVSGGCMNPSRAFASGVVTGEMDHVWIYWLGPMLGSFIGGSTYHGIFSTKPWLRNASCHNRRDNYDEVVLREDVPDQTEEDPENKA